MALIYDEEFAELLPRPVRPAQGSSPGARRRRGRRGATVEDLIAATGAEDLEPSAEPARFMILTSGTTGAPKGAQRGQPDTLAPLAAMFSRIPLRARQTR